MRAQPTGFQLTRSFSVLTNIYVSQTIFAADDIKRQLPEESKKFAGVDKSWKTIMKRTNGNPNCIVAGTVKGTPASILNVPC